MMRSTPLLFRPLHVFSVTFAASLLSIGIGTAGAADSQLTRPEKFASSSPPLQHLALAMPLQETSASGKKTDSAAGESPPVEQASLTNADAVASEIEQIKADQTLDATQRDRLLAPLQELTKAFAAQSAAADAIAATEKSLSRIEQDKAAATKAAAAPLVPPEQIDDGYLPIDELRQKEVAAVAQLAAERERLQKAEAAIANRKARLEKLPAEISALRREIETLDASSIGELNDDPQGRLRHAREALRTAQLAAAKQRLETLMREQMLHEAQAELLPLQQAAVERDVRQAEIASDHWSSRMQQRRQSQIKKALSDYEREIKSSGGDPQSSQILRLKDEWVEIIGETDKTERLLAKEKLENDKWSERLAQTQAQIAEANRTGARLSSSAGLQLQLLKNRLPSLNQMSSQITTIDNTIEKRRELLRQLELRLQGADNTVAGELPMDVFSERVILGNHRRTSDLPSAEMELLVKFIADLEAHLAKLADRRSELENLRKTVSQLQSEIDSHVIWIRSESMFRVNDVAVAWQAFRWIVHPRHLKLLLIRLGEGAWRRPQLILAAMIALSTMVVFGARLRRRIIEYGKKASSRQSLSLRPTFATTLLSFALTLPLVVLLWVLGDALNASGGEEPLVRAVAEAFKLAALVALPVELLRQWLRPDGLAIAHFNTDEDSIRGLRRWLRILIDIGLPILIVYVTAAQLGSYQLTQALSRLMFILAMVLLSVVLWRTLEPKRGIFSVSIRKHPNGWLAQLRHVWFLPITWLPIVFAVIAIMGYGSAASILIEQFYYTFWLCIGAFYIGGITRRWLLTQHRRLAWAVHRERLEQVERLGVSGAVSGVDVEPPRLEASEISAQTSRLVKTFLVIGTVIGVAWVWAPVLPAVGYLEAIHLWPSVNEKGEVSYITLADLVKTIPIVVLTIASVRNLPGLVEGVLLERLPLEKPVRYAITTLGTYALMFLGIALSSQTLGLRWDNIQWLVAALGVGLGFGLQEIFANFVSGLILLFEQPIRVGDVVTLGDTTGVVARIQMRATTVTNWDRQELIIPNKDLITGRLVNWTLTDTTNRVTINIGVAYGSDTDLAISLLKEICAEHPRIAKDPSPMVTFEGFGDSTLNLVLRFYLADLDNRMSTTHEVYSAINKRFQAAEISIAFPQRDLHLKSLPPELTEAIAQSQHQTTSSQPR